MNPDLMMGDELLKKTGAGNLFMIFGEPDIELRPVPGRAALPRRLEWGRAATRPYRRHSLPTNRISLV